ncbi:MAG: hypothetical protein HKN65_01835 [Woeseiaceae bacterium]|nr:hypothetical protein [Woeseiaceae bacterium]
MQEPFYFGPEDREIFGVYHPALGADGRVLTVICPPLYSEFNRSHAALRMLALALVQEGQHVMRMEYTGTGDSCGDLADASLAGWIDDISLAIDEGRDLSGCRRIRLLGVRGSALLASRAAARRDDIERLVLWDPAPSGTEYRKSLLREQDDAMREHLYLDSADRREIRNAFDLYRMPAEMWEAWPTLDGAAYLDFPPDRLKVVRTPRADGFDVSGVEQALVDFAVDWEVKNGEVFMCQPVLEGLLGYLVAS